MGCQSATYIVNQSPGDSQATVTITREADGTTYAEIMGGGRHDYWTPKRIGEPVDWWYNNVHRNAELAHWPEYDPFGIGERYGMDRRLVGDRG